ncbi:hypothetical protein ACJMK2_006677 [Sinanodonta woodiana]|uniref:Uncharacterized protein n=1 Tax=Sinanodonta woodiana TaxID=1069815 RepID=A0ABD3VTX6_SINWO
MDNNTEVKNDSSLCNAVESQDPADENYILTETMEKINAPSTDLDMKQKVFTRKPSGKYNAHVTSQEIMMMRLPAISCRVVNYRARQSAKEKARKQKRKFPKTVHVNVPENDGFMVKTGDNNYYEDELSFPHLLAPYPTTFCPDPIYHMQKTNTKRQELPIACPTCWSVQRNAQTYAVPNMFPYSDI